jgi:hypothetical protein
MNSGDRGAIITVGSFRQPILNEEASFLRASVVPTAGALTGPTHDIDVIK